MQKNISAFPALIYGNQNEEFTTSGYERTIEWLGLNVT